ncbi:MAG: hypothetical protein ACLFRT_08280 [Actinomycetota bacterium]
MLAEITSQIPVEMDIPMAAITSASLLGWVAMVYLIMGFGVRSGELVWSGRYIGRLPGEQRGWSLLYGLVLAGSGLVLLEIGDVIDTGLLPSRWILSAGFTVVALLTVATLFKLARGSSWERVLFAPITLLGAGVAAWLTFG